MKKPEHISKNSGVYIFKDFRQKPLYIGKAGNLKKRLAFYFSKSWKNSKISRLLRESEKLEIIETESEIEALIKEAELIKKYLPKYNVLMRDDKNYFYIGFTKEIFPRILITHQPDTHPKLQNPKSKLQTKSPPSLKLQRASKTQNPKNETSYIGPFTDGTALKMTLKLIRRIFPYCTCKELHKRTCLNAEIGRCPGFCCYKSKSQITKHKTQTNPKFEIRNSKQQLEYQSNIQNIMAVLQGKKKSLLTELKKNMKEAAKKQEFEKAAILRDQIWGLENVFEHRQILETRPPARGRVSPNLENWLKKLLQTNKEIRRIEGYDISNISGKEATGSMVVFMKKTDGTYAPDKSQYRKFKIKTVRQVSDVDMLAEVIKRRFNHPEWQYPDLIVIDGGRLQLNAAVRTLRELGIKNYELGKLTITALAKKEEELYIKDKRFPIYPEKSRRIKLKKQPKEILYLFQRVRDESHRFAKKYHHKLREVLFRKR